ncbi:MAG TPA: QueT transporter family protein [Bacillota bacterium]|nr:QueT transporter family protein [Bacillota bacterium]
MNEIILPFKRKELLLKMGLCALIFIGMAVPFKVMVLIEGLTEVRPVNAVPVVVELLFGPAGAWGCALGNLVADLFGTFSRASLLGFFANFIAAYLPYKIWHLWRRGEEPNVKSAANMAIYFLLTAISALAVAVFLACGLDVFLGMWIPDIFYIVFFNDLGFPLVIGLPVFIVLTCDEHQLEPFRPPAEEAAGASRKRRAGCILLAALAASQLIIAIMIAMGLAMSQYLPMQVAGAVFLLSLLLFCLI